jgi:lipid-binding SYLF domain-containing protein
VISKMKDDSHAAELLESAKGLLVVPHFTKAALIFGGGHGAGLLLLRKGDSWCGPAFYKTSGGSVGVQVGGARGSQVMLLMSDKAVLAFQSRTSSWSLSAGAGLTAVNYNQARESGTLNDVVIWSDVKGLFGGASVGATNIARDQQTNQVYYNYPDVTTQQILSGAIVSSGSNALRRELRVAQTRQLAAPVKTASPGQPSFEADPPVR